MRNPCANGGPRVAVRASRDVLGHGAGSIVFWVAIVTMVVGLLVVTGGFVIATRSGASEVSSFSGPAGAASRLTGAQSTSRGSSASRRPSPRSLQPRTASEIATPGAMATCRALVMKRGMARAPEYPGAQAERLRTPCSRSWHPRQAARRSSIRRRGRRGRSRCCPSRWRQEARPERSLRSPDSAGRRSPGDP